MTNKAFNAPGATADEIPQGLEKEHSYNRPFTVDIEIVGAGAYAVGEVIGGVFEVFDDTLARNYDGLQLLHGALTDEDNQGAAFLLHIFDKLPPSDFADGDDFQSLATVEDLWARRKTIDIAAGAWRTANLLKYLDIPNINMSLDTRQGNKGPFHIVLESNNAGYTATNGLNLGLACWMD